MNPTSKVIASSLALTAFVVAVTAGLFAGNPSTTILINALISTVLCQMLGLAIGAIFERVADDAVESYQRRNPVPDVEDSGVLGGADSAQASHGRAKTAGG